MEQAKTAGLAVALAVVGAIVTLAQGGGLPLPASIDPKLAAFVVALIIAAGTALVDSFKQQKPADQQPHG